MAEATLNALNPTPVNMIVAGVGVPVLPLKIRQLGAMFDLCEPVLVTFSQNQQALTDDFDGALTDMVFNDIERFQKIVATASEQPIEKIGEMSIHELVSAIGVLIEINPLFFSQMKKRLQSKMIQARSD